MRTIVYIDGFNLYYAILRNPPFAFSSVLPFPRCSDRYGVGLPTRRNDPELAQVFLWRRNKGAKDLRGCSCGRT